MKNEKLARISVTIPTEVLGRLDEMAAARGFANRSQALTELVRGELVTHHAADERTEIAGTITLVYDHHKPHLQALLTTCQHDAPELIVSTLHVHLNHHYCLEVLVVRGPAGQVQKMADALVSAKGVQHGRLTITTTEEDLGGGHNHAHG